MSETAKHPGKKAQISGKYPPGSAGDLIYRGVESDVLDYKAPVNWTTLSKAQKAKFVRHALAFANTRGGAIVVGVGEDKSGHPSLYLGLDEAQCHSFDPSTVGNYINSHVDPAIDLEVERPEIDGKRFAILRIKPFSNIPHVAIHGIEDELHTGVFYIRTASASSRAASRAGEMHDLIQRALRNQRELLGRMLRGILFESQTSGSGETNFSWPLEYDESVNYFSRRQDPRFPANTPVWDFTAVPGNSGNTVKNWPLADLREAALQAMQAFPGNREDLLSKMDVESSYATNVSLRGMSLDRDKFWQFFQSGLVHLRNVLGEGAVYPELKKLISAALNWAALFYYHLNLADEIVHIKLTLSNTENLALTQSGSSMEVPSVCRIPAIVIEERVSAATLLSTRADLANHFLSELKVRFNV